MIQPGRHARIASGLLRVILRSEHQTTLSRRAPESVSKRELIRELIREFLMRVLGIDPGTQRTGYGLVESAERELRLVECGVVRPAGNADLPIRLREIQEGLAEVIERTEPDCVVVEGVFYGQNVRSMVVLAHARGVAVLVAAQRDLPVFEYPPAAIKKAVVGSGAATKEQIAFMVSKHLRLATHPEPADAADACAAALCHVLGGRAPAAAPIAAPP